MLNEEEIENLKKQILNQIEKNFPDDKKEFAKEQISLMNPEEFERFLRNNKIIKDGDESEDECVFCSILSKKINSYEVGKNEKAIAVLEINPISKAHVLIIPKSHASDLKEKEIENLGEEIKKKIKSEFHPKEIEMIPSELFGHKIINVLPVYENEDIKSERMKATPEELEEVQKKLVSKIPRKKKIKKIKRKKIEKVEEEKIRLPKRIP